VYRFSVDKDHATLLHPQNCSISPKTASRNNENFKIDETGAATKKSMQGGPEKNVQIRK